MEFKGTKGEWSIEPYNLNELNMIYINNIMIEVWGFGCETKEELEANAKLIAAAPDLLKALQLILNFPKEDLDVWRREGVTEISLDAYHINKGLEAIEKALK